MAISRATDNKPIRRIAIFGIGVIGASWTPLFLETKMRTFIFAVTTIVAASWAIHQARAGDRTPAFDIVRNCSAEVADVGNEIPDCTKDEIDAKNELDKRRPQFGASDKQTCVGESSIGGDQSYVELLTCLEMSSGEFSASGNQIGEAQSTDAPKTTSEHATIGRSK